MILPMPRRWLLGGIASAALSMEQTPQPSFRTLDDVAEFVCNNTPRAFRESVQSSGGRFLYRGEEGSSTQMARLCSPEPDLLLSGTYPETDALAYFTCLERQLGLSNTVAKPSTGHVGTSVYEDAAVWGSVVSVWPLGTDLSYVWPRDSSTFYPDSRCPDSTLVVDSTLDEALLEGREVLFASWGSSPEYTSSAPSSFLALPSKWDMTLQQVLGSLKYGL